MTGKNRDPGAALNEFVAIVRRLRGPGGCPWDAQQTPETLKTYLLEEAYELIEALDGGDSRMIKEELGDLLLHLVFLSDLYQERGDFSLDGSDRGDRRQDDPSAPPCVRGRQGRDPGRPAPSSGRRPKPRKARRRRTRPWVRSPRPCRP